MILDKGKGPIVGKLRMIQLIEADLQLLIRIFLRGKNIRSIEKDIRISKYNFGSQKNYIIEEAILEKRLIYDCSIFNRKPTVYVITGLEVYYDRQLSNIYGMVEESVRISREGVKLILKVLLVLKYFICTGFGIS